MILPSMAGIAQHQRLGNVDWRMAISLAAGTLLGSYSCSSFAVEAPPYVLEAMFSVGMLFLGTKTLQAAAKGAKTAAASAAAAAARGAAKP